MVPDFQVHLPSVLLLLLSGCIKEECALERSPPVSEKQNATITSLQPNLKMWSTVAAPDETTVISHSVSEGGIQGLQYDLVTIHTEEMVTKSDLERTSEEAPYSMASAYSTIRPSVLWEHESTGSKTDYPQRSTSLEDSFTRMTSQNSVSQILPASVTSDIELRTSVAISNGNTNRQSETDEPEKAIQNALTVHTELMDEVRQKTTSVDGLHVTSSTVSLLALGENASQRKTSPRVHKTTYSILSEHQNKGTTENPLGITSTYISSTRMNETFVLPTVFLSTDSGLGEHSKTPVSPQDSSTEVMSSTWVQKITNLLTRKLVTVSPSVTSHLDITSTTPEGITSNQPSTKPVIFGSVKEDFQHDLRTSLSTEITKVNARTTFVDSPFTTVKSTTPSLQTSDLSSHDTTLTSYAISSEQDMKGTVFKDMSTTRHLSSSMPLLNSVTSKMFPKYSKTTGYFQNPHFLLRSTPHSKYQTSNRGETSIGMKWFPSHVETSTVSSPPITSATTLDFTILSTKESEDPEGGLRAINFEDLQNSFKSRDTFVPQSETGSWPATFATPVIDRATTKHFFQNALPFKLNVIFTRGTRRRDLEDKDFETQLRTYLHWEFAHQYGQTFLETRIKVSLGKGVAVVEGVLRFEYGAQLPTKSDIVRTLVTFAIEQSIGSRKWKIDVHSIRSGGISPSNLAPEKLPFRFIQIHDASLASISNEDDRRGLRAQVKRAIETGFPVESVMFDEISNIYGDIEVKGAAFLNTTFHVKTQLVLQHLCGQWNQFVDLTTLIIRGEAANLETIPLEFTILNKEYNSSVLDHSSRYYKSLRKEVSHSVYYVLKPKFEALLQVVVRNFLRGSVLAKTEVVFLRTSPHPEDVLSLILDSINSKQILNETGLQIDQYSVRVVDMKLDRPVQKEHFPGFGVAIILMCGIVIPVLICIAVRFRIYRSCRANTFSAMERSSERVRMKNMRPL
ncbi:serine-rich adhesin for platelets [Amia ocellicauda]|uniref:serine-rich adhesin for platelets n=1 Tax=Amia ocellicauda TaxID=2972642 RepID=UPI003463DC28